MNFVDFYMLQDEGSGPEAFAKSYYDASFSWKVINCNIMFIKELEKG